MDKNGKIRIVPSEPIEIPFLFNHNRTQLMLDAFDLNFNFILRDDFENKEEQAQSSLFDYNITLSSWSDLEIVIKIEYLNPLEVSTVFVPDTLVLNFIDPSLIKSKEH